MLLLRRMQELFNSFNELFCIKYSLGGSVLFDVEVNIVIADFSVFLLSSKNFCKTFLNLFGLYKMQTKHSSNGLM